MTAGGPLLSRPTGHTLRGTLRDLALEEINLRTGHLSPELAEDVEEHDKEDEEQRHHQHRRRADLQAGGIVGVVSPNAAAAAAAA